MIDLSPYLTFKGNCTEAMNFYKNCLGGELTLMTFKDSPMAGNAPAGKENEIVHSSLKTEKFTIMATDMSGPDGVKEGTNIELCFNCSSLDEMNGIYKKLSEGGSGKKEPFEFFAGTLANFTDKYGIRWLLYYDSVSKK